MNAACGSSSHPARLLSLAIVAAFSAVGTGALAQQGDELPTVPAELQSVRDALDKYRDPVLAVHDGYLSTVACVTFPTKGGPGRVPYPAGGMGVHFLNPALVGPKPDPLRPQVLLYEPRGQTLHLVAAEWFIPLATGVAERPALFG